MRRDTKLGSIEVEITVSDIFAVMKEYRGQSLGSEVIAILEEKALESGAHHIELSAQIQAKDFYKKLGYTEIGEIYKEEFCPHIKMFKDLK